MLLQVSFNLLTFYKPGILGISSSIDQRNLIDLTNKERSKVGLPPLAENQALDQAAENKAKNMFAENYWAHYSPSGKDPWGFITGSGYKFSYAGENLARNFYNSGDVVNAWMASPTHKDNIVNSHYQDVGIAVVEGTLLGEKTTLIVQEFATPAENLATLPNPKPQTLENAKISLNLPNALAAESSNKPNILIDPYLVTKTLGLSLILMLFGLMALDLYIIRKKAVYRISSRHLPHLGMLAVSAMALINAHPGVIL